MNALCSPESSFISNRDRGSQRKCCSSGDEHARTYPERTGSTENSLHLRLPARRAVGSHHRILTSVGMEPRINAASVPDRGAVSRRPTVRYLRARRASVQYPVPQQLLRTRSYLTPFRRELGNRLMDYGRWPLAAE